MAGDAVVMGAVAYDPKVVTIWEGFREWLRQRDLEFDFVLYSNYERQVDDLLAGRTDAAWNSPLAWVRARRAAPGAGVVVRPLVMRDTDRDLRSVVVVPAGSPVTSLADLRGTTVATGAVDSPQSTLLPLDQLRQAGLEPGVDVTVRRFDIGTGLHGDHIGGERAAARALADGEVDAACMIDANHLLFAQEGILGAGTTRFLAATPPYDHCNMTVVGEGAGIDRFGDLLGSMDYGDPDVRPLLDLEGLHTWVDGRTEGYELLERAVDAAAFYDPAGRITAADYRP